MSISVQASASPAISIDSNKLISSLQDLCEQSVEVFRAEARKDLLRRIATAEISEKAKVVYPILRDLNVFVDKYFSAIKVVPIEDGFGIWMDERQLIDSGIPESLVIAVEYGHPMGISPMTHWRTVFNRFNREIANRLRREFFSELS